MGHPQRVIVRKARAHGLPTPISDVVVPYWPRPATDPASV
ncbi:hypothetical protein I553_10250 [Mycobacterium xenopi 4042]|uniref:Uncharacterized protein n=1 Tax=Mycobacterium xenopi 4042 TaxID=1299334 RepID=X8ANK1_MYCXE|nr:hypothetical protein I553_10250 [Mycobacterium xenopi 4042]